MYAHTATLHRSPSTTFSQTNKETINELANFDKEKVEEEEEEDKGKGKGKGENL